MLSKPRKKVRLDPPIVVPAEQAAEVFPTMRYFQIHFEFLQEQIQLVMHHQDWNGIVHFVESRLTNCILEGINHKVQLAKRRARGYRNTDHFIHMIY